MPRRTPCLANSRDSRHALIGPRLKSSNHNGTLNLVIALLGLYYLLVAGDSFRIRQHGVAGRDPLPLGWMRSALRTCSPKPFMRTSARLLENGERSVLAKRNDAVSAGSNQERVVVLHHHGAHPSPEVEAMGRWRAALTRWPPRTNAGDRAPPRSAGSSPRRGPVRRVAR